MFGGERRFIKRVNMERVGGEVVNKEQVNLRGKILIWEWRLFHEEGMGVKLKRAMIHIEMERKRNIGKIWMQRLRLRRRHRPRLEKVY